MRSFTSLPLAPGAIRQFLFDPCQSQHRDKVDDTANQGYKRDMVTLGKLPRLALTGIWLVSSPFAFSQSWIQTSAPKTNWSAIAVSADGSKIVACVSGGLIYRSTDAGTNWSPTSAPANTWSAVASSADGFRLVAAANGNRIFTSVDAGVSWTPCSPARNSWTGVATSADGNRLVAVAYSGAILTSGDAGGNWTSNVVMAWGSVLTGWLCVSSSADGTKSFAGDDRSESTIYVTTDSGQSWRGNYAPGLWLGFRSIATSSDGQNLIAGGKTGYQNHCSWVIPLFGSTNSGSSWDIYPSSVEAYWCVGWPAVTSSSDGRRLAAITWNGVLFTTTNRGTDWASNNITSGTPDRITAAVAADGSRLFVAISGSESGIYTWQATPTPTLNIRPTADGLRISWIVPSMPFVLQETADLNATGWIDVTTQPTLNLTNLHHEVSVPLSSTNRFYRLKSL